MNDITPEQIEKVQHSMDIIARKSSIPLEGETFADIEAAYDVALDIMGKEIPKQVIIKPWSPSVCPRCGYWLSEHMGDGYFKHPTFLDRCPNSECSQMLKWD